jgi:hypothetical protein
MRGTSPESTDVVVALPGAALAEINRWADESGLTRAKFHTTALILGTRMMQSSLSPDFVDGLTSQDRRAIADAADASITREVLLQIVMGGDVEAQAPEVAGSDTEIEVSLAVEVREACDQAVERIGMQPATYYGLAFVTGARLLAGTLRSDSLFPLDLVVQSTERSVSPLTVLRATAQDRRRASHDDG